jgi:hypothetical protein
MVTKTVDASSPVCPDSLRVVPRRQALQLGAALAGGLLLPPSAGAHDDEDSKNTDGERGKVEPLPVSKIEQIIEAQGTVSNGVLDIPIGREDIGSVLGPKGAVFTAAFELHGDLYFQPLRGGRALLNADMALLPQEVNPFIAKLLSVGLIFQAYHQHLIDMNPQVWFVHFRGVDTPERLASGAKAAISTTAAPFPQMQPSHPTTPLDADRLASILHGTAEVGEEGVVTVDVSRRHSVRLDGVIAKPETGISTSIEFKPLGGSQAVVVPDFSMTSDEVVPVVKVMLNDLNWFQGCLYNQETDEHPQLYFDHMLKTGDAYELAREIRRGLDKTDSE